MGGELDLKKTVAHEEELIHRRLTWMLTFQGFLFAAQALNKPETSATAAAIYKIVPWLAAVTALLTFGAIVAAYAEIDRVRSATSTDFGSTRWPKWLGRANAVGLPLVIAAAWAYVIYNS